MCNTRILALFENVSTGLATALRFSFAQEAGGLSPRLCIVRDLTLCDAVSASYSANSTVNIAEVDAQGRWTGNFAAPLNSFEAARIVSQGVPSKARSAPAGRGLAATYSSTDATALQLLLNAASSGVLSIDVLITTSTSNVGQAVACLLLSGCADGNFSGVAPANIAPPSSSGSSGGGALTLSNAGGIQPGALDAAGRTAGAWAVAQVIAALANATNSSPAAFSGFVNLTNAKVSFEIVAPATSEATLLLPGRGAPNAFVVALATVGSLSAIGLLAFALHKWGVLKLLAKRPKADGAQHGSDGGNGGTLALREVRVEHSSV